MIATESLECFPARINADLLQKSIILKTADYSWKPHRHPSSVSQTDGASFTDPLWLDLRNQASPAWGSAPPVHVQLSPPHPPPVTGGREEKKRKKNPVSRQEWIDSAEGRKSGGGETGECVNGRVSWRRGRAVQAWDLPIWSCHLHNSI